MSLVYILSLWTVTAAWGHGSRWGEPEERGLYVFTLQIITHPTSVYVSEGEAFQLVPQILYIKPAVWMSEANSERYA